MQYIKSFLIMTLIGALLLTGCVADKELVLSESATKTGQEENQLSLLGSKALSGQFINHVFAAEYAEALALCAPELVATLGNVEGMKNVMEQLVAVAGRAESMDLPASLAQDGYEIFDYPATFEKGRFLIKVSVSGGQITGFFFLADLGIAEDFLALLLDGDYAPALALCGPALQETFTDPETMKALWENALEQEGAAGLKNPDPPIASQYGAEIHYAFPVESDEAPFVVTIGVQDGQVVMVTLHPADALDSRNRNTRAREDGPLPSDDLPAGVFEQDIIVNRDRDRELYGKLTYPADPQGPIPAVVLVHGSGPQDMDETMGENAFFKDLAYGLSLEGVAVMRYHKATYAYPEVFDEATVTIDEEVVDDAAAAKKAMLEQADGLEFSSVYVVGHSLGAMVAPRIAQAGGYDGMILLAGSPRGLLEIVCDQAALIREAGGIEGLPDEAAFQEALEASREFLAGSSDELEGNFIFGYSLPYLYSIQNPPAGELLQELDLPTLILHAEDDIQVFSDKDFAAYAAIAESLSDATTHLYPGLNHFFNDTPIDPTDISGYYLPAETDSRVISDIANWIKSAR